MIIRAPLRVAVLFAASGLFVTGQAEIRRALIVGINQYTRETPAGAYQPSQQTQQRLKSIRGAPSGRALTNLEGAHNDAQAMKEMLIARYGFEERNVILLTDGEATADRILGLLQSHLIDAAQTGDVSVFYYAGHGSRIRNTAARNANVSGFDSTLIPADASLGVPDVRSKELARIFAQAPRKGVHLTVIEDTCYSGGTARGALPARRIRAQEPAAGISVEETLDGRLPEDEGVLILTASQEYEEAAELPITDLDGPHGAFTWALLHAMGSSAANERVDRVFQRARALMQSASPGQEPVLLAKKGADTRGLFGPAGNSRTAAMAVGSVDGSAIHLNGGLAMNLHEGCQLKRVVPAGTPVSIRITKVNGLGSADAVISGDASGAASVRPGDLFELERWVAPDRELLRVFEGGAAPDAAIRQALETATTLRRDAPTSWIEDPTVEPPTHVLSWDGGKAKWSLRENRSGSQPIWIDALSAASILGHLPKGAKLFVLIPPSPQIRKSLQLGAGIAVVDSPSQADYVLLGRACPGSGCAEYAWALPNWTQKEALTHHVSLPLRTDWIPSRPLPAEALANKALALARIAGWLHLAEPAFENAWPYRLVLQNARTKQILSTLEVRDNEDYKLLLRAEPGAQLADLEPRRVYFFVIDSNGEAKLLFGDNLQNEFPRPGATESAELIPLSGKDSDLTVGGPFGIDNYFLLSSATPIDSPNSVFEFSGVRTRGSLARDPLARLLQMTGSGTRGAVTQVPLTWSIEHLTVLSRPSDSK